MTKTLSNAVAVGTALVFAGLAVYSFRSQGSRGSESGPPANHTALAPESPESRALAGMAELETLEQHLKKKPRHTPVLLRMAQVAREAGKPGEAVQHLRQVLQNEPSNREARLELGRALYETGDVWGAISVTQEILKNDPRDVDALYNLGAIYGNLNQDDSARRYWLQAVAAVPSSPSAQLAKQGLAQLSQAAARLEAAHKQ